MNPNDERWHARLWYTARTRPKSEHIAAAGLAQFDDVEVYCPRIRFQQRTRTGPKWTTEALFPTYLFVRFAASERLRAVRHANAVTDIVQFGENYAILPDAVIEQLRVEMGGQDVKEVESGLEEGDEIELVRGPFRGMTGIVTRLVNGGQRIRVLMELFGEYNEVEVDPGSLGSGRHPRTTAN